MKSLVLALAAAGLVLGLHQVFLHGMSDGNVVTTLFAAGGSGAGSTVLFALAFVGLRITVIILLPGLIAWHALDFLYQHLSRGAPDESA